MNHSEVLNISNRSQERGHVRMIFGSHLAFIRNNILKQSLSSYVACKPSYVWRCLIFLMYEEYGEKNANHLQCSSQYRGHVKPIFSPV